MVCPIYKRLFLIRSKDYGPRKQGNHSYVNNNPRYAIPVTCLEGKPVTNMDMKAGQNSEWPALLWPSSEGDARPSARPSTGGLTTAIPQSHNEKPISGKKQRGKCFADLHWNPFYVCV